MRTNENYSSYLFVSLILSFAILASFQIYIAREPDRIQSEEARDKLIAVTAGRSLYIENCAMCHGETGEGVDGPPLNDSSFLQSTEDHRIFSLISSGIPSSEMPAWNQLYGGPFTDQQVNQLVSFIRAWEQDAPDRQAQLMLGDAVSGYVLYNSTCVVCHGQDGEGNENAPMLNNPAKLAQFDDNWYFDTISGGRLSKGMPTWGTVLSGSQIRDLIALLRAWERGETVELPGPEEAMQEALHMLEHGDMHSLEHALKSAAEGATGEMLALINEAIAAVESGDQATIEEVINKILDLLGHNSENHGDGDGHDDGDH